MDIDIIIFIVITAITIAAIVWDMNKDKE